MSRITGLLGLCAVVAAPVAGADELNGADTAWILTTTALVLFMTIPGLALFYGGLVRTSNVLSVLLQCFAITCLVTVLWVIVGYSLAFSPGWSLGFLGGEFIGGFSNILFSGVTEDSMSGTIPESIFATFQLTFAIITPALIVGGFAERARFSSVLLFTTLWLLLVYCPIVHWVWAEDGWLLKMNLLDFAGGTVVHITAGTAAVVSALVMGNRRGFPDMPMPPHNMTMTITGAGMLWVGWFGFNGGSALAANGDAAMAITVTHISAAVGALTWMSIEWIKYGKPSALGAVTGMVAGLGTITPASGSVGPGGALIIGLCAGGLCFFATNLMKRTLKIDDSLDVFPVHAVGGFLGTVLTGIFASNALGVFSGREEIEIGSQLGIQLTGAVVTLVYTAVVTFIVLKIVDAITGLRVSDDQEREGLDIVSHNERGYDL